MRLRDGGMWEIFLPGLAAGAHYKYSVLIAKRPRAGSQRSVRILRRGAAQDCVDRLAAHQLSLGRRGVDGSIAPQRNWLREPVSMYEVHLESWLRGPLNEWLTYRELAEKLPAYAVENGFTHLELLPDHGASVFGIVGLSGDRLLRAHVALRHARRFPLLRRPLPSGRTGRDPGLGSRPFSDAIRMVWRASTAPRSTSTPIRARASIAIGAR